jgi:hypothetical protein
LDLSGYNSDIEVVSHAGISHASVDLITDATSGPTVDVLNSLRPRESGDLFELHLPKGADSGGSVQVNSFGGSSFSSVTVGGGMVMTGGGNADMMVNGQRIQVRGGRTYVNGVEVGTNAGSGSAQDPPMPIRFRAELPPGSTLMADTYNGDVISTGVGRVHIKTYNGDVRATGVDADSGVESYNGDLTVGSTGQGRPTVSATTYNGDVRLLDEDMRVRPRTRNGNVIYPN